MAERQHRMSRVARTARGSVFSLAATVLAAVSHALAGGTITPQAMLVTAIIALPFCVAFAGRVGSVWRVAAAVGISQFFYHWAFAGIGAPPMALAGQAVGTPAGSHAAHLASLERFVPTVVETGAADASMWILHGIAAALSVSIITRGERALLALGRSLRRALPRLFVRIAIHTPAASRIAREISELSDQLRSFGSRSLRGPPVAV